MKIESKSETQWKFETKLYDLQKDPQQFNPIEDTEVEQMMIDYIVSLMKENDCPKEQFARLGFVAKMLVKQNIQKNDRY